MVARSTEHYRRRREQGLCGQCGKVPTGTHARCDSCNVRTRSYKRPLTEEQRRAKAIYMLAYTARTKDQIRERHLRRKYGLSLTEYNALLEKQGHGCAICGATIGEPTRNRRLFVDHDHTTGKIRGLLCYRCNAILGLIKDRPDYLRRLANYLEPDSARKGRRDNRT